MQFAEQISITLTPDMLRAVRESVEGGEYASVSDAMRDAVRVWQRQRIELAKRLKVIRARIKRSVEDPRPDLTSEEVGAHMQALFARAREERGI